MTRLNSIERAALESVFITVSNDSIGVRLLKSIQVVFIDRFSQRSYVLQVRE